MQFVEYETCKKTDNTKISFSFFKKLKRQISLEN